MDLRQLNSDKPGRYNISVQIDVIGHLAKVVLDRNTNTLYHFNVDLIGQEDDDSARRTHL